MTQRRGSARDVIPPAPDSPLTRGERSLVDLLVAAILRELRPPPTVDNTPARHDGDARERQ